LEKVLTEVDRGNDATACMAAVYAGQSSFVWLREFPNLGKIVVAFLRSAANKRRSRLRRSMEIPIVKKKTPEQHPWGCCSGVRQKTVYSRSYPRAFFIR